MSEANLELAKRGIDAFNRRDVNGFSEVATADFEFVPALLAMVEGGSIRGREGLEAFFEAIPNTWDEFRTLAEDFRDLGVEPEDVVHPGLLGGWLVSKPPVPRRTPDEVGRFAPFGGESHRGSEIVMPEQQR